VLEEWKRAAAAVEALLSEWEKVKAGPR
jgi:hypothetical protein